MELTEQELTELHRWRRLFPFRIVSAVKLQDGSIQYFANHTKAKYNNYARKHNGTIFRLV